MSSPREDEPKVSIVIPTYNRRDLLRETLLQLTRQQDGTPPFEVVVSDDGSSDDSASVVRSFADRLRLKYCYQEDLGNRVSLARNAGARLASSPILVFLDTGALAGPDFVRQHFLAHQDTTSRCAVAGYAYGYNPENPMWDIADILSRYTPQEAVERYGDVQEFLDLRESVLAACGDDLNRRSVPWAVYWTINCSMPTADFWAVGGFDEGHRGWAAEDVELGYLLHRRGLPIRISRAAWVIESHQSRPRQKQLDEFRANMFRYVTRHPEPVNELGWAIVDDYQYWSWEDDNNDLLRYTGEVRGLDVTDEIEQALRGTSGTERVAIIGAGGAVPSSLRPAIVMDFDRELVDRFRGGPHVAHHALGLRTPLADQSVDIVVITSRLAGVWDRWKDRILAEANRIGCDVRCFV